MADKLYRQWYILRQIPRAPKKIDTATLESRLKAVGIESDRRTIQRDLHTLSGMFPLVCDDQHKPYGWSRIKGAEHVELPGMDAHTALTFQLAEAHLSRALPRSTLKHLEAHFRNARSVLKKQSGKGFKSWPDRIRVAPRAQPLLPAEVKPAVVDAVYEALLQEKRIDARYQGRADTAAKDFELNPLGLVLRDGASYLVCTFWSYEDVRYLPLQRFLQAKLSDTARTTPKGFSMEEYMSTGELGFKVSEKDLKLSLRVDDEVARTLLETPLSADQTVLRKAEGVWKVKIPAETEAGTCTCDRRSSGRARSVDKC